MGIPCPDMTLFYLVPRPKDMLFCQIFISEQKTAIYIPTVNDFDIGRTFGTNQDFFVGDAMSLDGQMEVADEP